MKQLFKKDSKSKIRIWNVYTNENELIQESGLKDGKLVKHFKFCTEKNVGKSNHVSAEQQAVLEMISLIKSKLDEGYFETEEDAKNELVILPMLAKSYDDEKHKINWNGAVYIQPKLDGMRCLAHISKDGIVKLISRDGKTILNMDHITNELAKLEKDVIFDGELYAHGMTFQENMKLIKKYRKNETEKIKYHIYDVISEDSYTKRVTFQTLLRNTLHTANYLLQVSTHLIKSQEEIKSYHSKFISEGYEGSIIRHSEKGYEIDKRSDSLLKYKDFQDIDAIIIDVIPNEANPKHGTPVLKYTCQKLTGISESTFKAGCKMSHEDREDLLTNKHRYIGKTANVRFFEWTDDGNPRFPVMIGIHYDR